MDGKYYACQLRIPSKSIWAEITAGLRTVYDVIAQYTSSGTDNGVKFDEEGIKDNKIIIVHVLRKMCVWDRSTGHVNICSPLLSVSFCSFGCLAEMLVMLSDYHILFSGEKEEAVLGRIQRASAFQIAVPLFNCKVCHSCLQGIFQSDVSQCPFPLSATHWQEHWEPWLLCNCSAGESFPLLLPSQGQVRARCALAQSPEYPLLFPLCRYSSVAVCSEQQRHCLFPALQPLLSISCSPAPALQPLLSISFFPSPALQLLLSSSSQAAWGQMCLQMEGGVV